MSVSSWDWIQSRSATKIIWQPVKAEQNYQKCFSPSWQEQRQQHFSENYICDAKYVTKLARRSSCLYAESSNEMPQDRNQKHLVRLRRHYFHYCILPCERRVFICSSTSLFPLDFPSLSVFFFAKGTQREIVY